MNTQVLLAFCLAKPGAYADCPFGPEPVCARVGKRIFAEIYLSKPWVTLRCEPVYGLAMREAYPAEIRRGYYCPPTQQPYHNTVTLTGSVPESVLCEMIDHSYDQALRSLTRAARAAALAVKP